MCRRKTLFKNRRLDNFICRFILALSSDPQYCGSWAGAKPNMLCHLLVSWIAQITDLMYSKWGGVADIFGSSQEAPAGVVFLFLKAHSPGGGALPNCVGFY